MYFFFLFKKRNYIVNWINMTRKYDKHLCATYGITGQLFRPLVVQLPWLVNVASLERNVDRWLSGRVSARHSVVAGSISSRGDHGIPYLWDLTRSKQLFSVSVCHRQVFGGFSGHGNSIYNNGKHFFFNSPKERLLFVTSLLLILYVHVFTSYNVLECPPTLYGIFIWIYKILR